MAKGDHLCVDTSYGPFVEHHGIDMGDGTVIHFRKNRLGVIPVIARTSMVDFASGRKVVIVRSHPGTFGSLPPDEIVANAEHLLMLQQSGQAERYNLMKFNCEHLANLCKTGVGASHQVEQVEYVTDIAATPFLLMLLESFPF